MRPEGLGNLIKIIHLIGSRTRDLQVSRVSSEVRKSCKYKQVKLSPQQEVEACKGVRC
jgi:hypothetical protein